MSLSLLWIFGLAVLLLVIVIRVVRPRASWESFRAGALADAERIRREARQATEAIGGEEALLPLRALLRELSLPAGVLVEEEDAGPEELRVLVTSPHASLMVRLRHVSCRLPGRGLMVQAGLWRLAVRDAGRVFSGAEAAVPNISPAASPTASSDASPDAVPDMWGGVWPGEESFDDLAACAARLQKCVVDPASALESLHVPSGIASEG